MASATSQVAAENAQAVERSSRTAWLAYVFSFPVMCMSLLSAVIFHYCVRGIDESDIWWHMRNARTLLEQHIFLRSDTYSFTAAGSPWVNFEWLSEIPYFLAYRSAGLQGLLMVYFTVLLLIYVAVYYRCCRAGADCKDAAVATLGAICLGGVSMAPRMLLFGWLCLTGVLLIVDHFERTGRGLWYLPPLFCLWINLHGSWVFGFVVLGATIVGGLVAGEWGRVFARRWSPSQLKQLLLASCVSFAVLFVNPIGYKLVWYPFDLLFRQQNVMQYIEEWEPVNFAEQNGKLALAIILAIFATALFSRRRWTLAEVMLAGFALWTALSHARFLFFAGLILAPMLAPSLKLFPPYERSQDKPWLNGLIVAAVIAGVVHFFPSPGELQRRVDTTFPRDALQFMQRQQMSGRVFNRYGWGGYMEWFMPELKPGIDGRADVFVYNGVFMDFLNAMALKRSFETLDKYRIDYILVQPNQPFAYLLAHSPAWQVIYADKIAVLFERTQSIAAGEQPNQ